MNEFPGKIKRRLEARKFNKEHGHCCRTGGRDIACPFLRLNSKSKWVCTLYRSAPISIRNGQRIKRLRKCLDDKASPVKRFYILYTTEGKRYEVVATSKKEAQKIFAQDFKDEVGDIFDGEIIEDENLV